MLLNSQHCSFSQRCYSVRVHHSSLTATHWGFRAHLWQYLSLNLPVQNMNDDNEDDDGGGSDDDKPTFKFAVKIGQVSVYNGTWHKENGIKVLPLHLLVSAGSEIGKCYEQVRNKWCLSITSCWYQFSLGHSTIFSNRPTICSPKWQPHTNPSTPPPSLARPLPSLEEGFSLLLLIACSSFLNYWTALYMIEHTNLLQWHENVNKPREIK